MTPPDNCVDSEFKYLTIISVHCASFSHVRLLAFKFAIILGDPGAVSRVDYMFVVTANFHHEHEIDPTNCPWVSEDGVPFTLHLNVDLP